MADQFLCTLSGKQAQKQTRTLKPKANSHQRCRASPSTFGPNHARPCATLASAARFRGDLRQAPRGRRAVGARLV